MEPFAVFISYAHQDSSEFAHALREALEKNGKVVWIDTKSLAPTSLWKKEIPEGIEGSIAVLAIISPASMRSKACREERQYAKEHGKKIIPILYKDPHEKAEFHQQYIDFTVSKYFEERLKTVLLAIDTDLEWKKIHTLLDVRSSQWKETGERDNSLLMRGKELKKVEDKVQKISPYIEPQPTDFQRHYVLLSRQQVKNQNKFTAFISCSTLLIICVIMAYGLYQSSRAQQAVSSVAPLQEAKIAAEATAQAEQDRADQEARIASAGQLADQAESIRGQSPIASFLLSVEAYNLFDNVQTYTSLRNNANAYSQILKFISEPNFSQSSKAYLDTIAFSADGKIIASSIDGTIILRNAKNGQQIRTLIMPDKTPTGHINLARRLAFSPNNDILATGSLNGDIFLWVINSGQMIRKLIGHQDSVESLSFSSDGQLLVSGGDDNTIFVWKITTGETVCNIKTYGSTNSFFVPPTNNFVTSIYASIPPDEDNDNQVENNILIWDTSTCSSKIITINQKIGRIFRTIVSQDSQIFAFQNLTNDIFLWDYSTDQIVLSLILPDYPHVNVIALSADGKTLALGYTDGNISLWDTNSGKSLKTIARSFEGISDLMFNPDGKALLSISGNEEYAVLWDLNQKENINILSGHTGRVTSVEFNREGSLLASGANSMSIILWDPTTGQQICTLEGHTKKFFLDVAFQLDGTLISEADDEETLLWDPQTCQQIPNSNNLRFSHVDSEPWFINGKNFSVEYQNMIIKLVDTGTSQTIGPPLIGHNNTIHEYVFNPDTNILASGDDGGTIIIWNLSTYRMIDRLTGHNGGILTLAFSPDGKVLASGGEDSTVRLWEIDPETWLQEVCQIAGRNFTVDEWNRHFPTESYRITCPQWPTGE